MYVKHLFLGATMKLNLPQGTTVFIMDKDEIDFVRAVLELMVVMQPETENDVYHIWQQLNQEENAQ